MSKKQQEALLNYLQQQIQEDDMKKIDQLDVNQAQAEFSWTLRDLLTATKGDLIGPIAESNADIKFTSISTDSRTIQPGALYIAIKGERFDGHDYISQAIKQGAAAVLVSQVNGCILPGVVVEDTRIALGHFACWHRQNMPVKKVVAVTGSNGKTTVKTMLNEIFSGVAPTLATQGNLNNDFGVPRTLLNIRPHHEYAIIEMGANHLKEIGYLTALALPDIAIVNNASSAHLEGFGSLQGIIDTKGEIYQGLNQLPNKDPGVAIINTDSAGFDDWVKSLDEWGVNQRLYFGTHEDADIKLCSVESADEYGLDVVIQYQQELHCIQLAVLGSHNAMNAAACTAIALAADLNWAQIKSGLQKFSGVAGRLQKKKIKTGWLLDDSYNANPESLKAGIDAVTSLEGTTILCIGAMAEVGETSEQAHQEIAEFAVQKGADYLFSFGEDAKNMPQFFGKNGQYFTSHKGMVNQVLALLKQAQDDNQTLNVLVKGSRSAAMEKVVAPILEIMQP